MIRWIVASVVFFLFFSKGALSAEHKDFWYKVEPTSSPQKSIKNSTATKGSEGGPRSENYDLELSQKNIPNESNIYWSQASFFGLGLGVSSDRIFRSELSSTSSTDDDSGFSSSGVLQLQGQFNQKGWRRTQIKGILDQRSSLYLSAHWQWVSSRQSLRTFYGLGFGIRLRADQQLTNFITLSNYRINFGAGAEWLITPHFGLRMEVDVFLGTDTIGAIPTLNGVFTLP